MDEHEKITVPTLTTDEALRRIRDRMPGEPLDLRGADLYGIDLRETDLRAADLSGADLGWANLSEVVDLSEANLLGTNLHGADLRETLWDGLRVDGLPSGQVTLKPTPYGWFLRVGCWGDGTVADLRTLIAGEDWPGASTAEERDRRRPGLLALADLCDAHIAANPGVVEDLAKRWGATAEVTR